MELLQVDTGTQKVIIDFASKMIDHKFVEGRYNMLHASDTKGRPACWGTEDEVPGRQQEELHQEVNLCLLTSQPFPTSENFERVS